MVGEPEARLGTDLHHVDVNIVAVLAAPGERDMVAVGGDRRELLRARITGQRHRRQDAFGPRRGLVGTAAELHPGHGDHDDEGGGDAPGRSEATRSWLRVSRRGLGVRPGPGAP